MKNITAIAIVIILAFFCQSQYLYAQSSDTVIYRLTLSDSIEPDAKDMMLLSMIERPLVLAKGLIRNNEDTYIDHGVVFTSHMDTAGTSIRRGFSEEATVITMAENYDPNDSIIVRLSTLNNNPKISIHAYRGKDYVGYMGIVVGPNHRYQFETSSKPGRTIFDSLFGDIDDSELEALGVDASNTLPEGFYNQATELIMLMTLKFDLLELEDCMCGNK